jgi:hypothetical protein
MTVCRSSYLVGCSEILCNIAALLFITLLVSGQGIRETPLPHVEIYLLCYNKATVSNNNTNGFEHLRWFAGFYNDLLPSTLDVTVADGNTNTTIGNNNNGSSLAVALYASNERLTEVTFSSKGTIWLSESSTHYLDETTVQNQVVTVDRLLRYFRSSSFACDDPIMF